MTERGLPHSTAIEGEVYYGRGGSSSWVLDARVSGWMNEQTIVVKHSFWCGYV